MRLNKYLAECGLGSRRACDKLIQEGKVRINGKPAALGAEVLERDSVTVSGRAVNPPSRHTYVMLHKPKGYITSASDEKGRKTVFELVKNTNVRLFPVGRLDYDTEGLLLLTNDGELCEKLTHPSHQVGKTYVAKIEGEISEDEVKRMRAGLVIDEGEAATKRSSVDVLEKGEGYTKLELVIYEGRNRQIRKMFEAVDKKVIFLKRTAIGEIRLGGLSRGEYRYLNERELKYLRKI